MTKLEKLQTFAVGLVSGLLLMDLAFDLPHLTKQQGGALQQVNYYKVTGSTPHIGITIQAIMGLFGISVVYQALVRRKITDVFMLFMSVAAVYVFLFEISPVLDRVKEISPAGEEDIPVDVLDGLVKVGWRHGILT